MAGVSEFDAVLFDLDGTVWDSVLGIARSLAHALEAVGVEVPDEAALAADVGPPLLVMLARHGVPESRLEAAKHAYRERYRHLGEQECEVYAGVPELLDDLRSAGVRLGTATSKGVEPAERMLHAFGLHARFDVVAAAAMDSTHEDKVAVVGGALARLGTAHTAMVGDRHYDIAGGRAHGPTTIGAAWGYGTAEELHAAGADHVVGSPADLRLVLLRG